MINPASLEATIRGIATALEDTQTLEFFRNGEVAFLLEADRITLLQRGPDRPPWPEIVTEVSPN